MSALALGNPAEEWRARLCLARVYLAIGRASDALKHLDVSRRLAPDDKRQQDIVRSSLAHTLLTAGNFRDGFELINKEWSDPTTHIWGSGIPMWDGDFGKLKDARLLVHHHQGLGDTIQFCRFLPQLIDASDEVLVVTPRPLRRLIETNFQVATTDLVGPIPSADYQVPFGLLPGLLKLTLDDLASIEIPYLHNTVSLSHKISLPVDSLNVGIAWRANPRAATGEKRSIPLGQFFRLAEIPGVKLYGLQESGTGEIYESGASAFI